MPLRAQRFTILSVATQAVLGILVLGAPLALGCVQPRCIALAGVLAGLSLVLHARQCQQQGRRFLVGWVPLIMALGAVWSVLQVVPLPMSLLAWLSPQAAELYQVMTWKGSPTTGSISGAPLSTAVAAGQLLACAAVAAVATNLGRHEASRRFLVVLVALSGGAVVVVGVVHLLLGLNAPYGRFPTAGLPLMVTSFVNANHAAASMTLGAMASLGLVLDARSIRVKTGWALLALGCAGGVFLCNSFGGVVGLLVGLVGTTALSWRGLSKRRNRETGFSSSSVPVLPLAALGLVTAVIMAAALGLDPLQLADNARISFTRKMQLLAEAVEPMPLYWLTGMGRGAFMEVYPRHMDIPLFETLVGPENITALFLLEWGIPFALLYMGAMLWFFARALPRNEPGGLIITSYCGVAAVVVHNLVDFNLELLGVALPFCVLLGVTGSVHLSAPNHQGSPPSTTRARTAAILGAVLILVVPIPALLAMEHGAVVSRKRAMAQPLELRAAALEKHLTWNRSDFVAALTMVRVLRATHPDDLVSAMQWANRALFLRPMYGPSHWDTAKLLWDSGQRSQAILEYKTVLSLNCVSGQTVFAEMVKRGASPAELRQVLGERDLTVCRWLESYQQPGAAVACAEQVMHENPRDNAIHVEYAEFLFRHGDPVRAEQLAREVIVAQPGNGSAYALLARCLDAQGQTTQADTVLEQASGQVESVEIERMRLHRAMARTDLDLARHAAARLGRLLEKQGQPLDEVLVTEGEIEERAGNPASALLRYRSASRNYPGNTKAVLGAVRVALSLGKLEVAVTILRDAFAATANPAYHQKLEELRGQKR